MDLSGFAEGALTALAERLASPRAPDPVDRRTADPIMALAGRPLAEARAVVGAVLAERARRVRSPELVWTGPAAAKAVQHRDTAVVLQRLFGSAQRRVVLAGYHFDHGEALLAPLHTAMVERGVEARLFVHVPIEKAVMAAAPAVQQAHCRREVEVLLTKNWPFEGARPEVWYDARPLETGQYSSMHAKCMVVDDRVALVTSANFTRRAHERNVEVGALIYDRGFVRALAAQWANAATHGLFERYHPAEGDGAA